MTVPGERAGQREAERRRRLAALDAGDPVGDEQDADSPREPDPVERDEEILREVPPHHG